MSMTDIKKSGIGILLFLSLVGMLVFGTEPVAEPCPKWVLEADSLASALQMFSVRHQVLTTYEDPILYYHDDLQDISSNVYRIADVRGETKFKPLYTKRRLKLSLEYHLCTNNITADDITKALQEIITEYNGGENPGRFKVEPMLPVWHISPIEVKDKNGEWRKVIPFLDKTISTQAGDKRLYAFVFSVMKNAISNTPFVKFGFNRNPIGSEPPDVHLNDGAPSLREFYTEIFINNFDGIIWQLECGATEKPGESLGLSLNLYQIKPQRITSAARQAGVPRREYGAPLPVTRNVLITPKQDSSDPELFYIDVEGSTPLADTLEGFMRLHRVLVTYEDPQYEYPGDLEDQAIVRKNLNKYPPGQVPKALQPKSTRFQAVYRLNTKTGGREDIAAALRQIIKQYNNSARTAEFKLLEGSGILHIVPARVRNQSGAWQDVSSLLDKIIHSSGGETNFTEFASSALQECCLESGMQLLEIAVPPPLIITLPEGKFTLREILARLITENYVNMTWFMLCDPSDPPMRAMAFKYYRLPEEPLDLLVPHLIKLDGANWKAEVMDCSSPVLVAFLGSWSEPARDYATMLDELSMEYANRLKVAMVDIGEQHEVAAEYNIRAMPTLLLFVKGAGQKQTQGIASKSELRSWIESALNEKSASP
jgi:thioredoxin 1